MTSPLCRQTLRRLLELTPGDAERLQLLAEAAGLLAAAPPGAYPVQVPDGGRLAHGAWLGVWRHSCACPAACQHLRRCCPAAAAPQELRWLVTTAWNRGAVHARFGRAAEAAAFQRWAAAALAHDAALRAEYQARAAARRRSPPCLVLLLACRMAAGILMVPRRRPAAALRT